MEYNEYIAKENKVLFNIDNFTYGNRILSAFKLNLIEIDINKAKQLKEDYNNKIEELNNKYNQKDNNETISNEVLELNEETNTYEQIDFDTELVNYKNNIVNSLIFEGYIINDIQIIKHNTNN